MGLFLYFVRLERLEIYYRSEGQARAGLAGILAMQLIQFYIISIDDTLFMYIAYVPL